MRPRVLAQLVVGAVVLVLLAGLSACRRGRLDELQARLGPLAQRILEPDGGRGLERTATGGGRAQGHAASLDALKPPAGYVLMRPKAQLAASQGNALLLVDESERRVVPIFVGNTEALSIRLRLDGEHYDRPLTHDLLDTLLRRLGAKLESVRIDELRGNVFIGTVVVRDRDGQQLQVDSRASDAVALALGNKAPIFMAQTVLDRAGYNIDELDKKIGAGASSAKQVEPTRL